MGRRIENLKSELKSRPLVWLKVKKKKKSFLR